MFWNVETWSCGLPQQSACGVGSYESGIDGCFSCPALPEPNDPIDIVCSDFASANYNWYDGWLDVSFAVPIHEAFDGVAHIAWQDDTQQTGEGDYYWFFQPGQGFRFEVQDIPDTAQQLVITAWWFGDACGFQYVVSDLPLVFSVQDGWQTACGG